MLNKEVLGIKFKWFLIAPAVMLLVYLAPFVCAFYLLCGLIDLRRHGKFTKKMLTIYFMKKGLGNFLLSPLNLFFDLLAGSMKAIYKLHELPLQCQNEINEVIKAVSATELISIIDERMKQSDRGMIFFKWYGKNIKNTISISQYQKEFKYIRTIGVSAFNKHKSTKLHFGPLRASLRVLYNLRPIEDQGVYIQVYKTKHYWHDNPLFIFDDTFLHQSFNESDHMRYCLFIDIVRPSLFRGAILNIFLKLTRFITLKINYIFYKNWSFLK